VTRVPWAATSDAPYASWRAELPAPGALRDLERLADLAAAVVDAGRTHGVFDVLEAPGPERFDVDRDGPYERWLRDQVAAAGRLPLFDLGWGTAPTSDGQLRTPATLAYPDANGAVHEDVVSDVGAVLRRIELWPDEYERWLAAHVPPLHVHGGTVRLDTPRGTLIRFALPTSVWFPWVRDPYGDDPAWWRNPAGERNAPRLNAFLEATRAAVEQAGGTWVGAEDEDVDLDYRSLVDGSGIVLGATPDPPGDG
jgi:hypothetical protein